MRRSDRRRRAGGEPIPGHRKKGKAMSLASNWARHIFVPAAAVLALAASCNLAAAQLTSAQQNALRSNCRSDFVSKCAGVTPGGKDALVCLQKNVASLSPGCQTVVRATIPAPAPAAAAPPPAPVSAAAAPQPPAPARATITSAPPPRATLRTTPPKPQQTVAAPPAAEPAAVAVESPPAPTPEQLRAIQFTCRRDFNVHCRGVPAGGTEALACLRRSAAKLAPNCKTSLAAIADRAPVAPATAVIAQPPATRPPKAPIAMTAVIGRACLRDLVRHCRNSGAGDGQKIACLTANADRLTIPCKAAMKITTPLR